MMDLHPKKKKKTLEDLLPSDWWDAIYSEPNIY